MILGKSGVQEHIEKPTLAAEKDRWHTADCLGRPTWHQLEQLSRSQGNKSIRSARQKGDTPWMVKIAGNFSYMFGPHPRGQRQGC